MKTFEEIKERAIKGNGYITYNNKTYYFTDNGAYVDDYEGEPAVFADAYTGEKDEYGELILSLIRWDYIGSDMDDTGNYANWNNPVEIIDYTYIYE